MAIQPQSPQGSHTEVEQDYNLVETWLQKKPKRWVAGAISGLIAGLIAMVVASILSVCNGLEPLFALKLMASPFLGVASTELVTQSSGAVIVGLIFVEVLGAFWGFIFSHFVSARSAGSLLAMGLVWGIFTWIFNWNLMFQSFHQLSYIHASSGAAFFVCVAFGLSLSVIGLIDRE